MKKATMLALFSAGIGLLLASPATAANKTTESPKITDTKTAAKSAAMHTAWPPETLTGKIDMVVPGAHEVIVKDSSGVPFDLLVTHGTHIRNGDQAITLQDLEQDPNISVSVRFVPERGGDIARSITIG